MAKMIHSMIRVAEEARAIAFYEQAFGLSVAQRVEFDSFTLIYMSNPETGFELELTVNKSHEGAYNLGNGYGHLAFSVDDIAAEHARLSGLGISVGDIKSMDYKGQQFATFFFLKDPDGYSIEVLQRSGRFK